MYHEHLYSKLPGYEAGNYLVECEWLVYIFMVLLVNAISTIPIYLPWMPVMAILAEWTRVIKSTYIGDQRGGRLDTNNGKSTATGAWHEGPSTIDGCRSAQLGPNEDPSTMTNAAMLSDWEVLDAIPGNQEEREQLKCFERRLAALHDVLGDLHGRGALRTACEGLIEVTGEFIRSVDSDLGSRW